MKQFTAIVLLAAFAAVPQLSWGNPPDDKVQKIRFVEDDGQNYMTSKIYTLQHQKANDVVPFVLGAVKRYAKNSTVDRINYSAGKQQLVAVTCPTPLIPYIDDLISKLDRPGTVIEGTGITRNVYNPQWRSGEKLVNLMVKTGISSNASEGANQDAIVAYDAATNQIYWKDSVNKDKDLKKYLALLDRPIAQCTVSVNVYEIRESELQDIGLDYLAWKNGPGLNLFEAGANFITGDAVSSTFGPYGFFMFAPAFDMSFVRMLQQNGIGKVSVSANVTLTNGHDAEISFAPNFQNLVKDEDFASAVNASSNNHLTLKIQSPVIARQPDNKTALLNFKYDLAIRSVVERDNHGNEIYDENSSSGKVSYTTGKEHLLTCYESTLDVEQTIGVPFLCEVPVLKYIFGTTTTNKEKVYYLVSVNPVLANADEESSALAGKVAQVEKIVK